MSDGEDPYALVPELGDLLTIVSDIYKSTTGRIVFRDGTLIRVKPTHLSNRGVNFPLDPESGLFREALGVTEVIMHEKARDPHFAVQLAVFPGERLEFYSTEGDPVAEEGVVRAVVATDTEDAIELEDGRRLDFAFVGPQAPIDVIVQRAALEDTAAPENNGATGTDEEIDLEEEVFPEIDFDLLPAALVEEIPTSERTYSDSVQREDMFVSLLLDIPVAQQKNPRVLRNLYRKTDVLLALKNSVVVRDETGAIDVGLRQSYQATSLREALLKQPTGAPLAALMPVAAVKKVLYTDDGKDVLDNATYRDVTVRQDVLSLTEAQILNDQFRASSGLDERGGGNPFLTYLDALLRRQMPAYVPAIDDPADPKIQVDQDVLRSRVPQEPVEALGDGLPPAALIETGRRARARESDPTQLQVAAHLTQIPMPEPVRLLAASRYRNPNTGQVFQTAPADTATTVAHVVLTAPLTAQRLPTRSSVLLWDIDASEASRAATQSFYAMMRRTWDAQRVVGVAAVEGEEEAEEAEEAERESMDISLVEELEARVAPTLQLATRQVVHTLDALGFRNLEMDGAMLEVLVKAMEAGRAAWDAAFAAMQQRVLAALEKRDTVAPVLDFVTAEDTLWTEAVKQQPNMAAALEDFAARETSLEETRMARALYFTASETLRTLWWSAAASLSEEAMAVAANTYVRERRRQERAEVNALAAEAAIAAQPTVNECPHVYLLESIRSIRDEAKRMRLLEDFVTKYRSGIEGNWVMCGSCSQHLVCRHELALLHEFAHPGRGVAIHKSLLLEFGGPVFEGAYICKNCGQKIADLEYDTSLEFDDEGKPLVGRTVVAEEGGEAAKDELDMAAATEEEGVVQDTYGFTGEEDLSMFYLVRSILEFCGIPPDADMYRRVVRATQDYMKYKIPPETFWEANRKTDAAKKRFAPYAAHKANSKLTVIGALAVLEILTTDVSVPFPLHGCKFVRGGFPLDAEGSGTMTYVACVIAGILRLDEPWTATSWAKETNLEKRKAAVFEEMNRAMVAILAIQPATGRGPTPLTGVTEMYKTALQATRDRRLQADFEAGIAGASRADRLPPAFRPLPYVGEEGVASTAAVTNVGSFETSVATAAVTEIGPVVAERMSALTRQHVGEFHASALSSAKELMVLSATSPRSDSVCCFQRIGAVATQGLGIQSLVHSLGEASVAEAELLATAAATVSRRDPAVSANGTHMYVPWSAPPTITHQAQTDASVYYRLFLKHCFRGANLGGVHEIDESNICRQCLFELPAEFRFMTVSDIAETDGKRLEKALAAQNEERQALALRAFADQGVLIDEASFRQLEDAIHQRKALAPPAELVQTPLVVQLEMLGAQMVEGPLLSSATADWNMLIDLMSNILRPSSSKTNRRMAFAKFVERYDAMREGVQKRMGALSGTSAAKQESVKKAMEGLDMITKDVEAAQAVLNVRAALVITGEQVAKGYKNVNPRVTKWFPRVNRSHEELLKTIWQKQAALTERAQAALLTLRGPTQCVVRGLLDKSTAWLGAWLKMWVTDIRVVGSGFTAEEYQYVLRWLVFHVMAALLTDESVLYRDVAADVRRQVQLFFTEWFIDVFKTVGRQVAEFQMSAKEIQDAILARTELEKRAFINKFDQLDREMRRIELEKKKLKIGDWAVGTVKNLFSYDADFYEFERGQRAAMGLPEFAAGVDGGDVGAAENPYGFFQFGEQAQADGAYDHRARHDEDE